MANYRARRVADFCACLVLIKVGGLRVRASINGNQLAYIKGGTQGWGLGSDKVLLHILEWAHHTA